MGRGFTVTRPELPPASFIEVAIPPAAVRETASKTVIEKALMAAGREIELVQRHKAEEDIAVAAASILARDEFVKGLAKLEQQFAMKFPKGASAAVDKAAKEFVEQRGAGELARVSKTHFRTALRAQGLPEPPKTEWKKR